MNRCTFNTMNRRHFLIRSVAALPAFLGAAAFFAARTPAADRAFSDPANLPSPPAWAVGFANRAPDLDALPGFQKPPPGFGTVPFFWWLGDPLTQERLGWILEQMAGMGVSGYQINYAHSDQGGHSYGLTYPSEPPLFSDDWWKLTGWFMQEAKKQGAGVSLSDYTLGFGQGWFVDALLRKHPEVMGQRLRMDPDGQVTAETVPWSLNPMHPRSGQWYCDEFFGQFERRFPGEGGQGLNFFFSDELGFGVSGRLWSAQFADEFKQRKGYDITPELPALFQDIGPRTPKIRLDYNDVLVALSEAGFFKPVFDWHQQRGMIMGCDHGGRGRDVVEFGDYFRTQRWNQGPGADQPGLGKDLIKAKVAASIAHLYERPRVWLEGFYGSGWGTTSAGVVDATFANYVMGFDLLGIHGMYYSTHGGWWEWAPPDNTFRMPYWPHLRGFMDCVQRLSYHGLRAQVHDEFLAIGQPKEGPLHMPTVVNYTGSGGTLTTAVIAPRALTARALAGGLKPSKITLNGELVTGAELRLRAGANPLVLQYEQPSRAYFVVSTEEIGPAPEGVLASRWWNHPAVLPFDVRAQEQVPVGWYRFVAPPGLRALTMKARGKVRVWIEGQPLIGYALTQPARQPVTVLLRVEQERGCYGGAAFPEPIRLDCGPGLMALGDWSANDGLLSYSGGAWYRKTVTIPPAASVILDLGKVVASTEVRVNGRPAGIRVSPPWRFDITALVEPGANRIEVLVCNTLANHYTTVPTRYRGDTTSGLLGPVTLQFSEAEKAKPRKEESRYLKMGDWLRKVPPPYVSVDAKLAAMDASGIEVTLLSTNDPGPERFGDDGPAVAQFIHDSLAGVIASESATLSTCSNDEAHQDTTETQSP